MLYPLKFREIFVEKLWGGQKLAKYLAKDIPFETTGESWEVSAVGERVSEVAEGPLTGNSLVDLAEVYMGELLGDEVWNAFGTDFPLLIKFIDAADDLSVQVHPDDDLAYKRYGQNGKNELWYVVAADPGAELVLGFEKSMDKQSFLELVQQQRLSTALHRKQVSRGDAFFIPAGLVHAIGKGVLIAEIQQSSDTTYRIDDFNRTDINGNKRELHIAEALEAIHFEQEVTDPLAYSLKADKPVQLFDSEYFRVRIIDLRKRCEIDYAKRNSFTIFMCPEGNATINTETHTIQIDKGETVFLPAVFNYVELETKQGACLLEIYL